MCDESDAVPFERAAQRMKLSDETLAKAIEKGLIASGDGGETASVDGETVRRFEANPDLRLSLPLTAKDVLCLECEQRLPLCDCG